MPVAESSYAVECVCGTLARGVRSAQSQVVHCPGCGKPVFVFPASPLPVELLGSLAGGTAPELPALKLPAKATFWLVPASAALAALVVVGFVIASIVRYSRPTANGLRQLTESDVPQVISESMDAARADVAEGAYRLASQQLELASSVCENYPSAVDAETQKRVRSWRRQVALLADLSSESIEEIMRHSLGQSDREWHAVFRERYAGRAVVLDSRVFCDAAGRHHIDYQLTAGGLAGEWNLESFELLSRLPLRLPQRVVFGFRLADIARTGRDRWIVRPEPGSGVLFTDEAVLAGLSFPIDNDLRDVLRRQAGWDVEE